MSSTILSTKILSPSQKSLVLNAGLQFAEYNAITIKYLNFEFPKGVFDALIFTSQNGVRAFLNQKGKGPKSHRTVFCVGGKTKSLLEENGFQVLKTAPNAELLGSLIASDYGNLSFLLVNGNLRREELPSVLKQHQVLFEEVIVYETLLNPKLFKRNFDGVLFFSPSGAVSFFEKNKITGTAFCIGKTTAKEVQKHTEKYIIANKATVENVLVQAVKYFDSRLRGSDKTQIIYD